MTKEQTGINLVIQTAFLGDTLLSIPLLAQIREIYPEKKLWYVCREGLGTFLQELKLVDHVIEVKKNDSESYKSALNSLQFEFENIFVPHESVRTAWFVKRLKGKRKIGFKKWWNLPFFSLRLKKPKHLPDALRQLFLLSTLSPKLHQFFADEKQLNQYSSANGIKTPKIPDWLSMKTEFVLRLPAGISKADKKAVFAPGSQWATKRWTIEGFVRLGAQLKNEGYDICIVGTRSESEICSQVADQIPGSKNLCGQTDLIELLSLIKIANVLVVNDSGVMHMASVAGTPTVALFGPTTLDLGYRPWQNEASIVEKELRCRPCGKHGHMKCPIGTHECMKSITSEEVRSAILALVSP